MSISHPKDSFIDITIAGYRRVELIQINAGVSRCGEPPRPTAPPPARKIMI
jgi:hypothetical protein